MKKIKAMDVNEMAELLAAIAENCNSTTTECSDDCPLLDTEDCTACGISRWLESTVPSEPKEDNYVYDGEL